MRGRRVSPSETSRLLRRRRTPGRSRPPPGTRAGRRPGPLPSRPPSPGPAPAPVARVAPGPGRLAITGPERFLPVATSNREPCAGQVTTAPSSRPPESRAPSWLHRSLTAWRVPPTFASRNSRPAASTWTIRPAGTSPAAATSTRVRTLPPSRQHDGDGDDKVAGGGCDAHSPGWADQNVRVPTDSRTERQRHNGRQREPGSRTPPDER